MIYLYVSCSCLVMLGLAALFPVSQAVLPVPQDVVLRCRQSVWDFYQFNELVIFRFGRQCRYPQNVGLLLPSIYHDNFGAGAARDDVIRCTNQLLGYLEWIAEFSIARRVHDTSILGATYRAVANNIFICYSDLVKLLDPRMEGVVSIPGGEILREILPSDVLTRLAHEMNQGMSPTVQDVEVLIMPQAVGEYQGPIAEAQRALAILAAYTPGGTAAISFLGPECETPLGALFRYAAYELTAFSRRNRGVVLQGEAGAVGATPQGGGAPQEGAAAVGGVPQGGSASQGGAAAAGGAPGGYAAPQGGEPVVSGAPQGEDAAPFGGSTIQVDLYPHWNYFRVRLQEATRTAPPGKRPVLGKRNP